MTTEPTTAAPAPAHDLPPVLKTGFNPNGDSPNGSPHPSPTSRPGKPPRASRKGYLLVAGLLAVVAVGGVATHVAPASPKGARPDPILYKVHHEPLNLTVVERGALESADNREMTCRVKAGNKAGTSGLNIKWVIDDGAQVKQGDLLMEIEDSALEDQLKAEKIVVD